ncbi:MAG: cbb3-type cytochrome c oxidase subunit 3 [Bdellovibrionales bacterium]|nr:cbb3-type cytochrome c oxidase subunit 3 [Ramlibacter sp.]
MDVTTLRIAATVACFITFIAIMVWACLRSNLPAFEEAAQLPFVQD